jgi:hypothetical protein
MLPVVLSRNGADWWIGRRLPQLLRRGGLEQVGVGVRVQADPSGHSRRTIIPDLARSLRKPLLEMGLASEAELDELDLEARTHLEDPETVAVLGHLFLAWGRKPI